eukprot:6213025-Pleurochrysis_carterae.AAC.2
MIIKTSFLNITVNHSRCIAQFGTVKDAFYHVSGQQQCLTSDPHEHASCRTLQAGSRAMASASVSASSSSSCVSPFEQRSVRVRSSNSLPSSPVTRPPAARTSTAPAAVSHALRSGSK